MDKHRARSLPRLEPVTRWVDRDKSIAAQFAVAAAFLGLFVCLAAYLGSRAADSGGSSGFFTAAIPVMLLDGVKHIGASLALREYTPGVVTAVLVEVPYTLYVVHRMWTEGLIHWPSMLLHGLLGVALVVPLLFTGFLLGRTLAPARSRA